MSESVCVRKFVGHQDADLIAIRQLDTDLAVPRRLRADEAKVGFRIVEPQVVMAVGQGNAVPLGVGFAHAEQRLHNASNTHEGTGTSGGVHIAGVTVTGPLWGFGGVMHQQDRAVRAAGDVAEHRRDSLDLFVGVLVHGMRLDERIDDEQADIVFLDLFDARIDIGLPDNLIVALHLCEQQRTIGAGVQRDAPRTSENGKDRCCRKAPSRRLSSSRSSSVL